MTKYTKTKKRRAAGAKASATAMAAVGTAGINTAAATGPLEAETHCLAVEASRTYRKAMGAAQSRRVEQLGAPAVPAAVKGFVGLAALRKRAR